MAPLPVIRRGFGGAGMNDLVHHVDRLVLAYQPKSVVLFARTNDLGAFTCGEVEHPVRACLCASKERRATGAHPAER